MRSAQIMYNLYAMPNIANPLRHVQPEITSQAEVFFRNWGILKLVDDVEMPSGNPCTPATATDMTALIDTAFAQVGLGYGGIRTWAPTSVDRIGPPMDTDSPDLVDPEAPHGILTIKRDPFKILSRHGVVCGGEIIVSYGAGRLMDEKGRITRTKTYTAYTTPTPKVLLTESIRSLNTNHADEILHVIEEQTPRDAEARALLRWVGHIITK